MMENQYETNRNPGSCYRQPQQSLIILHINIRICPEFVAENLLVLKESGKKLVIWILVIFHQHS